MLNHYRKCLTCENRTGKQEAPLVLQLYLFIIWLCLKRLFYYCYNLYICMTSGCSWQKDSPWVSVESVFRGFLTLPILNYRGNTKRSWSLNCINCARKDRHQNLTLFLSQTFADFTHQSRVCSFCIRYQFILLPTPHFMNPPSVYESQCSGCVRRRGSVWIIMGYITRHM